MTYTLRVPQDENLQKEFDTPSTGTIVADEVNIQVDFISTTVRAYEMYLTVDVENVRRFAFDTIKAECRLPDVKLGLRKLNLGHAF